MASKQIAIFFVIGVVADFTYGAAFIKPIPELPDHPGQCYTEDKENFFAVGETFNVPFQCLRYQCEKSLWNRNKLLISAASCGAVVASPPCEKVAGNMSLPYPDCCPTIECDDDPSRNLI